MKTIFQALLAAVFSWFSGWLQRRKAAKDDAAVTINRDGALRDSQAQRDKAEKAVETSHAESESNLDQLHMDAARPDSLRQQSDDAQRAIDAANDSVQ